MGAIYEIQLYEAIQRTQPFTLGVEAVLGFGVLEDVHSEPELQAVFTKWSYLNVVTRINGYDYHQIRLDLAPDDPMVSVLRDTVGTDSLIVIWRYNIEEKIKQFIYAGFNRTIVDQARASGSLIFNLYGSGPTELLQRRIVLPPTETNRLDKSGYAEVIMKEYVNEQAASPVDNNRLIPGLTIESGTTTYGLAEYSAKFNNLLDVVSNIAEQGFVDFKVIIEMEQEYDATDKKILEYFNNNLNGKYLLDVVGGQAGLASKDYSAYFDTGVANLLTAEYASSFNGVVGTLSLWIKVSDIAEWTDSTSRFLFYTSVDGTNIIFIRKSTVDNTITFGYAAGGTTSIDYGGLSSTDFIHLVFVWDTSGTNTMTAYVNSVPAASTPALPGVFTGIPVTARVGASNLIAANPFLGNICHVALWDIALTATQVENLYNQQENQEFIITNTSPASLIGYWPMNEHLDSPIFGRFLFRVANPWGTDKRTTNPDGITPVVFDLQAGNMQIPIYSQRGSKEVNAVYVGGAGQGGAQEIYEQIDEAEVAASPWNRREGFTNAPDAIVSSDLGKVATRYLYDNRPTKELTFNVQQSGRTKWLRDWKLGDYVSAKYADTIFHKQISEINIIVTASSEGSSSQTEVITAEFIEVPGQWLIGIIGKSELGETTLV